VLFVKILVSSICVSIWSVYLFFLKKMEMQTTEWIYASGLTFSQCAHCFFLEQLVIFLLCAYTCTYYITWYYSQPYISLDNRKCFCLLLSVFCSVLALGTSKISVGLKDSRTAISIVFLSVRRGQSSIQLVAVVSLQLQCD
jgi:hypothetical protein